MNCPFCQAPDSKVIDSRLVAEGAQVRRRRECQGCAERWTTFEVSELVMPRIIKRDGSRQPFDEDKLRAGMLRALEKRPVSSEQIEEGVHQIKRAVRSSNEREVKSSWIGEQIMGVLRKIDEVAYVRFASVYRSFQDVSEFQKEIDRMHAEEKTVLGSLAAP